MRELKQNNKRTRKKQFDWFGERTQERAIVIYPLDSVINQVVYLLGEFCHRFLDIVTCFSACFRIHGFVFLQTNSKTLNQSINQSINKLINQYINQSINKPIHSNEFNAYSSRVWMV